LVTSFLKTYFSKRLGKTLSGVKWVERNHIKKGAKRYGQIF